MKKIGILCSEAAIVLGVALILQWVGFNPQYIWLLAGVAFLWSVGVVLSGGGK